MYEPGSAPVAVAVPHDGVESALWFAAREALERGCPVRAVGPAAEAGPGGIPDFLRRARADIEVLAGPGVPVDVYVDPIGDTEAVLARCRDACLVVVHRAGLLDLLHALSYGPVGAHALTDVACVPTDWMPRRDDDRPVVLGVDDAFHAEEVLASGVAYARAHQTWLRVVHAWDLHCRLGDEQDAVIRSLWATELERRLRQQVCALGDDVRCDVEVRHGVAAEIVLEAAEGAQQLLLGRNAATSDHRCHLGRTARTALRESRCPVTLLADGGTADAPS